MKPRKDLSEVTIRTITKATQIESDSKLCPDSPTLQKRLDIENQIEELNLALTELQKNCLHSQAYIPNDFLIVRSQYCPECGSSLPTKS